VDLEARLPGHLGMVMDRTKLKGALQEEKREDLRASAFQIVLQVTNQDLHQR